MKNIFKIKKLYIYIVSIIGIIILLSASFFVFKKFSPNEENLKIENYFLKSYSQKKFIKDSLKSVNIYRKNNFINFIEKKIQ